jgi:hypothetical protein
MGTVLRDKCRKVRQFVATYLSRRELDTKGFMILKLHVVAMIIGTLSTMVAPSLQRVREKAFVAVAIAKIRIISSELAIYIETEFEHRRAWPQSIGTPGPSPAGPSKLTVRLRPVRHMRRLIPEREPRQKWREPRQNDGESRGHSRRIDDRSQRTECGPGDPARGDSGGVRSVRECPSPRFPLSHRAPQSSSAAQFGTNGINYRATKAAS